jgi:hypothetical protein
MCSEPGTIAKSNVILDVKPWDDETDMKLMEEKVRSISCDGMIWGVCQSLIFTFFQSFFLFIFNLSLILFLINSKTRTSRLWYP